MPKRKIKHECFRIIIRFYTNATTTQLVKLERVPYLMQGMWLCIVSITNSYLYITVIRCLLFKNIYLDNVIMPDQKETSVHTRNYGTNNEKTTDAALQNIYFDVILSFKQECILYQFKSIVCF